MRCSAKVWTTKSETRSKRRLKIIKNLGAEIVDVELPNSKYSIAVYYIIATAEASSNLARFDGVRYGFRAEERARIARDVYENPRRRFRRGSQTPHYARNLRFIDRAITTHIMPKRKRFARLLKQDFLNAFERCDAILTPTSPTTAFKIGEKSDDPLAMYLSDIYTASANLAGIPGISVPCGVSTENLPIGLQLVGKHWSEDILLNLANVYENEFPLVQNRNFAS